MSALKRKGGKVRDASEKSTKRQKIGTENGRSSNSSKEQDEKTIKSAKSLLSAEQPAFPRGGAGALTLLEKKQIRAQASRDIAQEAQSDDLFGGNPQAAEDSVSENEKHPPKVSEEKTPSKRKGKKSKLSTQPNKSDTIPVESISHKRLSSESLLLGCVSHISTKGLTLSLPNNLSGFAPLTSISKQYTSKLERSLHQDPDEAQLSDVDANDNTNDIRHNFQVGQFLRVAVSESDGHELGKKEKKRKIMLSLEPSLVNRGLVRSVLVPGITVQASIVSIEDHGAVVDIGLGHDAPAFISKQALPKGLNVSDLQVGSVFLCSVTSMNSKSKAVQLSADLTAPFAAKASSSVDAYLPGTLADILLTQVTQEGLVGKLLGVLDATADALHSNLIHDKDNFSTKYQVGQKVTGRIIANFPMANSKRLAFSMLPNLTKLENNAKPQMALSSTIDRAEVVSVIPNLGVYLSIAPHATGFAHISRLSDQNVDVISEMNGAYKKGSEHRARILDYNATDNLYILSLQRSILEQRFLRLEDIEVGQVVTGTIETILQDTESVNGLLVRICPGITGLVPPIHMSDVLSKKSDKKFKEGASVKARVLSIDLDRRRLKLTMKKTLVNSDQPVWSSWDDLQVGQSTVGTLTKVEPHGAKVQFYGRVTGRLPVSEMSEAFIKDATEHFKVGQVITVHTLRVDSQLHRLTLTARDPSMVVKNDTSTLNAATQVSGTVFEKNADDLMIRLETDGVIARLPLDHICDGSERKRKAALDKIRVGQHLEDLLLLEIRGRHVNLSNKVSLREAAREGKLLKDFEDLKEDKIVTGYISNITENRVFVVFAQGITGVVNKAQIPEDRLDSPDFGMTRLQPLTTRVIKIDYSGATPRFWLSMKTSDAVKEQKSTPEAVDVEREIVDPIDDRITSYSALVDGAVLKVRITSIKETQINVEIAKGIQGRIQVSEAFDRFEDIRDRKRPLKQFSNKQIMEVRIIGRHDSRSYRFLPLSHRSSKNVVFELSARPSMVADSSKAVLRMQDLNVGESHLAFVNNISENSLMVNLSPAVRGRIRSADVSDDLNLAANLRSNFPIGSVLKTKVLAVDVEKNHLDLSAKTGRSTKTLNIENVNAGDIVAGRVTKITDRAIIVQLSENLVGAVELIDMADDFDLADTTRFSKDQIVRAYVLRVDAPNKKIFLSLRPSKILSSRLDVKDPEVSLQQIQVNDVRRGFISNVSEKGVFITLAQGLTAFVRVTNLSDDYLKDWKNEFQKDQLVRGKIIAVDKDSGHVQMSLRKSHVENDYRPPVSFHDMKVGQIVRAKVAKIETFGIFIVVENSENVRGLCHRSEIAEKRIEDVTKAGFTEGDMVKAKVLKIDSKEKRINFGIKASYFQDEGGEAGEHSGDIDEDDDSDDIIDDLPEDDEDMSDNGGVNLNVKSSEDEENLTDGGESDGESIRDGQDERRPDSRPNAAGLSAGGFDWFGTPTVNSIQSKRSAEFSDTEETSTVHKKKKKKPEIKVDRTGDLDKDGPQSVDDYERLLLSEPDNAQLWVQFMAFHLDLGDVDQARETGNKALRSIGLAQEAEKMVVWSALLNLETAFGDEESTEATLQRACETNEPEEVYSKLASIYIHAGKKDEADSLFQRMVKKFTQNPKLWINYATFLFDGMEDAARARALLPRALQALPPFTHFDITSKFAQLEFKTKTGVPEEGRTRFQGLVNLYPKRLDLFNIMIDLEMKLGEKEQVRSLFDQVLSRKLKPAKAKPFFQRWQDFEQREGDEKKIEEVQERAARWVAQYQKQAD